ncbi:MAG: diaminopimelate decarboxylase [Actinobacteria bacterium]|nr:diaminopimelate decarboxylase [Actinomycetota bacterium]
MVNNFERVQPLLPCTAGVDGDRLVVGGCDTLELAERFGTPLVVLDRATFETRAGAFCVALSPDQVFYAAKAFCCVAACELAENLGLGLDVCTDGELATAITAGFPPPRMILHGNNKSARELEVARDVGVGRVVVDSFQELDRIARARLSTKLLVRVTPGIEAHTHSFIQTGQEDSKFGFGWAEAFEAVERTAAIPGCELIGLHAHIGSQIFEPTPFELAIELLAGFAAKLRGALGLELKELNLGGGFGISHSPDEMTLEPEVSVPRMLNKVTREFSERGVAIPQLFLEPGRAIVGAAGVTLYTVGTVKRVPGARTYVSVDGGMSDNIRPALYGARYEAVVAGRMGDPPIARMTVAGKHCESGDVLIEDAHLPENTHPGDVLCIPATGAYSFSLASNYNRVARPAVVMVEDGTAIEIVARETTGDLVGRDRRLNGSRP